MYDIKPLEEEWKKYKKKKRRPWFVLIFSIFFILLISFTFLNYKELDFLKFNDKSKAAVVTNHSTAVLIDKALTTLETKKPKGSEVSQITETKPMIVISENSSMEIVEDLPIAEDVKAIKEPSVKIETLEKPRKKMHINIIESTSVSAYKDVERRFEQSHDTEDSLFLARSYYNKKNYKKAEYWALQTNKVNGNIEESWLIFTKSKVKLGRKNEAIHILTNYVKKSNSVKAQSLLNKIKKGTQ
ncbi:CDC27 family protein [Sulfurovum sp. CS9]|uniref:CDC27 family protein n=1 Tax=Sulfurovum sp. CS9 TaxID=3391146 RepID=UPI0039ED2477